jgi:hypothetical protein
MPQQPEDLVTQLSLVRAGEPGMASREWPVGSREKGAGGREPGAGALASNPYSPLPTPDSRFPKPEPRTPNPEPKRDLALEVLRLFGEARLPVTGASMLPNLWPGDVLIVKRLDINDTRPGDVVLAHRAGLFVAHRVISKLRSGAEVLLLTRGDRLDRADPPVAAGDLLGRVTAIERGGRRRHPRLTLPRRLAAWPLRRSDFATRALLYLRKLGLRFSGFGFGKSGLGARVRVSEFGCKFDTLPLGVDPEYGVPNPQSRAPSAARIPSPEPPAVTTVSGVTAICKAIELR